MCLRGGLIQRLPLEYPSLQRLPLDSGGIRKLPSLASGEFSFQGRPACRDDRFRRRVPESFAGLGEMTFVV